MLKPGDGHIMGKFTRDAIEGVRGQAKGWNPGRIEQDKETLVADVDFTWEPLGKGAGRKKGA